jgi:sugar phosphate isomerase/epimerase
MQVQLGCFTYVFSEFPFPKALEAIAGAGYRGVGQGSRRAVATPADGVASGGRPGAARGADPGR